jgi:hypothetical protein
MAISAISTAPLSKTKERAGRPKDLAALPLLKATLDELNRQS